jgi:DNA-binding HxlR family transcriptional regulator
MTGSGEGAAPDSAAPACRVRSVLDRIGDKWAIYAVDRLGAGPHRFSQLLRGIDGITPRMLTVTLRGLERDGLVTRTVRATVPVRVDYALTPLGETLREAIGQLVTWADAHLREIEAAQVTYDRRSFDAPCPAEAAG